MFFDKKFKGDWFKSRDKKGQCKDHWQSPSLFAKRKISLTNASSLTVFFKWNELRTWLVVLRINKWFDFKFCCVFNCVCRGENDWWWRLFVDRFMNVDYLMELHRIWILLQIYYMQYAFCLNNTNQFYRLS